jgi:hypothetical protein
MPSFYGGRWALGLMAAGAGTFVLSMHEDKLADKLKDAHEPGSMVSAYYARDLSTFGSAGLALGDVLAGAAAAAHNLVLADRLRVASGVIAAGGLFLGAWSGWQARTLKVPPTGTGGAGADGLRHALDTPIGQVGQSHPKQPQPHAATPTATSSSS